MRTDSELASISGLNISSRITGYDGVIFLVLRVMSPSLSRDYLRDNGQTKIQRGIEDAVPAILMFGHTFMI